MLLYLQMPGLFVHLSRLGPAGRHFSIRADVLSPCTDYWSMILFNHTDPVAVKYMRYSTVCQSVVVCCDFSIKT